MKTRTTKKTVSKSTDSQDEPAVTGKSLAPNNNNPPMLFILPEDRSADSRIVSLPHPVTKTRNRYFSCPELGLYEFTRIAAPKKSPSSWLLAPNVIAAQGGQQEEHGINEEEFKKGGTNVGTGYTIEQPDLFLATPMDPLFFLLPALASDTVESNKRLFLSIDDHIDTLSESSRQLKYVLRAEKLRKTMGHRADAVCDSVEAGDEKMYRLSEARLTKELISKARSMVKKGLPASMEQKFVQEALQAPVAIIKNEEVVEPVSEQTETLLSQVTTDSQDSVPASLPTGDSQASQATGTAIFTEATSFSTVTSAGAPSVAPSDEVLHLLRIKTALDFICSSYIPVALRTRVQALLSSPESPLDLSLLDTHLKHLAVLRKEAQALRSLSDNISRKRTNVDDEEAEEARAEKKRKKDEEEAKKKNQSRGVKQLSKVNTTGMKKMSSFFTKAPAKTAK